MRNEELLYVPVKFLIPNFSFLIFKKGCASMRTPLFTGSATAIITPFTADGVDFAALGRLLDEQLRGGADAIVVCGTTGEAATMSYVERMRAVEFTVRRVDRRVPVIAGTGSNSTQSAITLSRDAALAGVDGVLVVTPYYNKATQEGLVRHYFTVADAVDLPLITYDVPSRTGVTIAPETYVRLATHPRIVGTKEASGNFAQIQKTRELCGDGFAIWSGNDEDTAAVCLLGGSGVISVAGNLIPGEMAALTAACRRNDFAEAGRIQLRIRRLCEALFWEVNPIPVKTALALMGRCEEIFRLPLTPMAPDNRARLREVLAAYGLV